MPEELTSETSLKPGDFYEDCAYHPCLCISTDREEDNISGISLIDGSFPRSCSFVHCGVRKLSREEAMHWKFFGPLDHTLAKDADWTYAFPNEIGVGEFELPRTQLTEQGGDDRGLRERSPRQGGY